MALLAGSNADVDRLNNAAHAIRRAAGDLAGPEPRYRQAGGRTLALAVGDHVRVHKNDYRAHRATARTCSTATAAACRPSSPIGVRCSNGAPRP